MRDLRIYQVYVFFGCDFGRYINLIFKNILTKIFSFMRNSYQCRKDCQKCFKKFVNLYILKKFEGILLKGH